MNVSKLMLVIAMAIFLFSCGDDDESTSGIGSTQSPMGEVGNTFSVSGFSGVSIRSASVTNLKDGVSTVSCSGSVSDDIVLAALQAVDADMIPGTISMYNNEVSADIKIKITEGGAQSIFNDGTECTIINYNSGVGDKYSVKRGGKTLEA
ncbi:MAG: hypothetical protein MI922_00915, partial [Bacteroidales bacterium]|nr:hypothetical protein [Bacteroidales bacterium]